MSLPTIYEVCEPRGDILRGEIADSDFAADLARVLNGDAARLYQEPARFFANTHPTRGLKNLLANVFGQLAGNRESAASIFRLDTNYGGGKTHALIALAHVAAGLSGVDNIGEFIDPKLVPQAKIRVAAYDGENADPVNGRLLEPGLLAHTPWGELAYALGGREGYETVRQSDEQGIAPGADTLRQLVGQRPALILLDELSVYLRKAAAARPGQALEQLTAFMTALFKAVENSPRAALVYTLAIGKGDGKAVDAYSRENEEIARGMRELESVSARKATLLDPTEEDETVKVLRRRLFGRIDEAGARQIVDAYIHLWDAEKEKLASDSQQNATRAKFYEGYPLHPELMDTLTEKTATIGNFQRVRGMLRILARLVERLWNKRSDNVYALHLHHIDPSFSPIRQEILTRWQQGAFAAALKADIAAADGDAPSLAEQMDAESYAGAPYTAHAARSIFLHSLAFNEDLKGATRLQLRYSILAPGLEIGFIDDAVRRFRQESAYLDDRPNHPLRFLSEPNLTQMIHQRERQVDGQDVRNHLKVKIQETFKGQTFTPVFFPANPNEIEDGIEKPSLAVLGYEATFVSTTHPTLLIPDLVGRLFRCKNSDGVSRLNRNNLLFIVADEARVENMKGAMRTRLALEDMQRPEAQEGLAPHQKEQLKQRRQISEQELAIAIQQTYRHIFYPSRNRLEGADMDLNHAVIEVDTASCRPGDGQKQIISVLGRMKLRLPGQNADSPEYMSQRTPLKNGIATTRKLLDEYRQNTNLAMIGDESILIAGIAQGIASGDFVYRKGALLCGKGDPWCEIEISDEAEVMTKNYALDQHIWPRKKEPEPPAQAQAGERETDKESEAAKINEAGGNYEGAGAAIARCKPADKDEVTAEAPLREALTLVWELARQNKFDAIGEMTISVYDANDGFTLLGLVGALGKCGKKAKMDLNYETARGGECAFEFSGGIEDAQAVKAFFGPQLRAAANKDVTISFTLRFAEGLPLARESEEAFTARLTHAGAAGAYIQARARRRTA